MCALLTCYTRGDIVVCFNSSRQCASLPDGRKNPYCSVWAPLLIIIGRAIWWASLHCTPVSPPRYMPFKLERSNISAERLDFWISYTVFWICYILSNVHQSNSHCSLRFVRWTKATKFMTSLKHFLFSVFLIFQLKWNWAERMEFVGGNRWELGNWDLIYSCATLSLNIRKFDHFQITNFWDLIYFCKVPD